MVEMNKRKLEARVARLARENPQILILDDLRKARLRFLSSCPVMLEAEALDRLREEVRAGRYRPPLIGMLRGLDVGWYAVLLEDFCKAVMEIVPEEGLRLLPERAERLLGMVLGDPRSVASEASLLAMDPDLLAFVAETPIIPALRELSKLLEETRGQDTGHCPVCGRPFTLALYRGGRRYLLCKLCGTRTEVDMLHCVGCGRKDLPKMAFLRLEGEPALQLEYCPFCRTYLKALHEGAEGILEDGLLLDLATLDLDALAEGRGLVAPTRGVGMRDV